MTDSADHNHHLASKQRPYWHVDAKWVFGLLLCVVLGCLLLTDTLTRLTHRATAIPLATTVIALQFSPEGLDAADDFERLRAEFLASEQAEFHPVEDMPLVLSRQQVEDLNPRELRLALFRQLAEPLYDQGVEGFAQRLTTDPVKQAEFSRDASLLGLVGADMHQRLVVWRWVLLAIVGMLTIPVVYFSYGLGRLISPGLILMISSGWGSVIYVLSRIAQSSNARPDDVERGDLVGLIGQEIVGFMPQVMVGWVLAFSIGLILLITALVISLYRSVAKRK